MAETKEKQNSGEQSQRKQAVSAIYGGLIDRPALDMERECEQLQQSVCKKVIDEIKALYEIEKADFFDALPLLEMFKNTFGTTYSDNSPKEALLKLHDIRKLIKREYFDDEQYDNTIEFLSKIYKKTNEPQLEQLQIHLTGLNDESETTDPPSSDSDSDVDYGGQIKAVERARDEQIASLQVKLPVEQEEGERKESDIRRRSIAHQAAAKGAIRREITLVRQRFAFRLGDIRRAAQARYYRMQMKAVRRRILQKALTPDVYEIHRADIRFKRLVKMRVDNCHRFQKDKQVLPQPDDQAYPNYEEAYNKLISGHDSELTDDECYRILEHGLNLVSAIKKIDDYIGTHGPGVLKQMDLYLEYHLLEMRGGEDRPLDWGTFSKEIKEHLKIEKKIIELVQEKNTKPLTLDYLRRELEGKSHPDPRVVETKDVPALKRMLRGDLSDLAIDELGERKEAIDDQLRFLYIIKAGKEYLEEDVAGLTEDLQGGFADRVELEPYLKSTCQLIEENLQVSFEAYYFDGSDNHVQIFEDYERAQLQDFQFRLKELQNVTPAHFEARESVYRKCQELQRCAQAYIQAQVQNTNDLEEKRQAVVAICNDFKPDSTFISDMYVAMKHSQPWRTFDRGPDVAKNRKWKLLFQSLKMSDDLIKNMPYVMEKIMGFLIDMGVSVGEFVRDHVLEWQNSSIELDTPPTVASLAFAEKYVAKQRALEEIFRRVEMMEKFEKAREELRLSKMSPTQRKVETARLEYQEAQATLEYTESALKNNDVTFQQDPDGPPIIASSAAGQKLQEAKRNVSNALLKYKQASARLKEQAEQAKQKNIKDFNKNVKERFEANEEADEKAQSAKRMTQQQTKISEATQRQTKDMQGELDDEWWSSLGNIVTVEAFKMALGAALKQGTKIAFENISPATFQSTLNAMQKESGAKATDAWVVEGQRVLEALKENAQGAGSFTISSTHSANIFQSKATIDFLTRMEDFVEKAGFMKNLGSLGADSTILAKLLEQNTFNDLASKVMTVGFKAEVGLDGISVEAQAQIEEAFKNHSIDQALRGVDAGLRTGVSFHNMVRNNMLRFEMDADTRDILEALVGFARVDADEFCEGDNDSMGICAAKPATIAHESARQTIAHIQADIEDLKTIDEYTGLYSKTFWFGIFLQVAGTASIPWTGPAGLTVAAKGATMSATVATVNRGAAVLTQANRLTMIVKMKDAATKGLAEFDAQVNAAYQLSTTSTNLLGREAALRGAGKNAEALMVKQYHTAFREVIKYIKDVAATQSNPSRADIASPLDTMRGIQELSPNLWENEIF